MPVQQKTIEYNPIIKGEILQKKIVIFPLTKGKNSCDTSWTKEKGIESKLIVKHLVYTLFLLF